jgi:hypothetical protein
MKSLTKNVVRKRPGRPATGQDPVTAIRLSAKMRENVEAWAAAQDDEPGRSEAIRRLVEIALEVETPSKPTAKPGRRRRAQELATNTIEKMIDPSASPDEREQRRRRLTKGPPEFREDRIDQPKRKG